MKCAIAISRRAETPVGSTMLELTYTNTTEVPQQLYPGHGMRVWAGSVSLNAPDTFDQPGSTDAKIPLAPGASHTIEVALTMPLVALRGISCPTTCDLDVRQDIYTASDDPEMADQTTVSHHLSVPLDTTDVDWLVTDYGGASGFFAYGAEVYAATGHHGNTALENLVPGDVQTLTRNILLGKGRTHFLDFSKKRAPKGLLTGLNAVFYRTEDDVFTNYGRAKVDDPASFEVVDMGHPSLYGSQDTREGYMCSYARDAGAAYFFCESTSTKHAIKLRACKTPGRLESLGQSYARDDKNVYLEGRVIKGADPASFQRISGRHARDKSGIWYLDMPIEGADPDTFEVLDDPIHAPFEVDRKYGSNWSRDSAHEYDGWMSPKDPERSYAAQCARFAKA